MTDTPESLRKHYPNRYGRWAGNSQGHEPDFARCCESLMDKYHPGGYQCTRKRGHGPDGAYCKQHAPEAVAARQEKSNLDYAVKLHARMKQVYGPTFLDALRKIAAGHNDPRALATEIVSKFDADYKPKDRT